MSFSSVFTLLLACSALFVPSIALQQERQAPLADLHYNCINDKQVALTFDDGPYKFNAELRGILKNKGVPATFFFNGANWGGCIYQEDRAADVLAAYKEGHQIASHTWAHLDLKNLTFDQIHDEMWRVEDAVQKITGATVAMMRPPYGSFNDMVRQVSFQRGQTMIIWNLAIGDADNSGNDPETSKNTYADNQNLPGILTLNHETYESTVNDVVPYAIDLLQGNGYTFVTLADCINASAYQGTPGAPGSRDDSWTCQRP